MMASLQLLATLSLTLGFAPWALTVPNPSDCLVFEQLFIQSGVTPPWGNQSCCDQVPRPLTGPATATRSAVGPGTPTPSIYCTGPDYDRVWWAHLGEFGLSGPMPNLSSLSALSVLTLSGNSLSGPIPSLAGLVNLSALDLSGNRLSGLVPPLPMKGRLMTFRVAGNKLSGEIPELLQLKTLSTLDLSHNQLTGSIPLLPPSLENLYVQGNNLTGNVDNAALPNTLRECNLKGDGSNQGLFSRQGRYPPACAYNFAGINVGAVVGGTAAGLATLVGLGVFAYRYGRKQGFTAPGKSRGQDGGKRVPGDADTATPPQPGHGYASLQADKAV